MTNAHVVEGADSVTVSFDEDGDAVHAEVKGVDIHRPRGAEGRSLGGGRPHAAAARRLVQAEVGDPVIAIGNPFGYSRTVTTGIVSGLQRQIEAPNGFTIADVIQTDASINPGNSGGACPPANGRVIGINSQIATGGGQGSVGIGFAVPINTAKELLPEAEGRRDDRARVPRRADAGRDTPAAGRRPEPRRGPRRAREASRPTAPPTRRACAEAVRRRAAASRPAAT